jgi:hypothetical protein
MSRKHIKKQKQEKNHYVLEIQDAGSKTKTEIEKK